MAARGLVISAPASGSGKTLVTLGILRALRERGLSVASAKSGPDYIDPGFHEAATGQPCVTLDAWAMKRERLAALAAAAPGEWLIVEGAMGLFDGAGVAGEGSTADLAAALGLPVVLVIDAGRQGHSAAALAEGFHRHRGDVQVAGLILNRVGSARHAAILGGALAPLGLPVLGMVPRQAGLELPSRHLGLVQAREHPALEGFLGAAAAAIGGAVDLEALLALAAPLRGGAGGPGIPPLGQRIAVARDEAFSFLYPHLLADWQEAGAEILFFAPLSDQAPDASADAVFLPGGYPELHAGRIAAAARFRAGMERAAASGALIYGECGGFMVLGEALTDARDEVHPMLGLLGLRTSFAERRLHLGYRRLEALPAAPLSGRFAGHEFHHATTVRAEGPALFSAREAGGEALAPMGLVCRRVCGSFAHLVDRA
ncbi:MAG TPA: cobyrinate a,c-diamide synthase [Paracoccaceae bacterium]|nr:cobyrinate a,c-diamide synthase [Paracoccaceae bacterium]